MNNIVKALRTDKPNEGKKVERMIDENFKGVKKLMQLNDIHFPFQDDKALNLALQFMEDFQPNIVVLNGDILDCSPLSKFHQKPVDKHDFKKEVDMYLNFIDDICDIVPVETEIIYTMGNHEQWYNRFVEENPHLWSMDEYKLENVLQFDTYRIKMVPYEEKYYPNKNFAIFHGDKRQGGKLSQHSCYSAKNTFFSLMCSNSIGHTHRAGVFYKTSLNKSFVSIENGCLCNLQPKSYVHNPDWQHSISYGYFEPRRYLMYQIPFFSEGFIYGNKKYKVEKNYTKY